MGIITGLEFIFHVKLHYDLEQPYYVHNSPPFVPKLVIKSRHFNSHFNHQSFTDVICRGLHCSSNDKLCKSCSYVSRRESELGHVICHLTTEITSSARK